MKPILNGYFDGTIKELRGFIVLSILVLTISILRFFVLGKTADTKIDLDDFHQKASLIAALNKENHSDNSTNETKNTVVTELFYFNPNTANKSDFERLGLSGKTAQSIINYRNKGGKFKKPQDFKKIYRLNESDYQRLESYINIPTSENVRDYNYQEDEIEEIERVVELFEFNPNTASKSDFERLGLSGRTAQSIINYRNSGATFKKPQDFKKIYTLSESDYQRLKPYIKLPKIAKNESKRAKEKDDNYTMKFATTPKSKEDYVKKSTTIKIDINKATAKDFQQLKGVGKGFANRIIKYRKELGGFTSKNQVGEVYGFPKDVYSAIQPQLTLKSSAIQKININTAAYDDLVKHPYIDGKRANAIVKYRKQHGKYQSVNDLGKIYAIPKSTLKKIKPYLMI